MASLEPEAFAVAVHLETRYNVIILGIAEQEIGADAARGLETRRFAGVAYEGDLVIELPLCGGRAEIEIGAAFGVAPGIRAAPEIARVARAHRLVIACGAAPGIRETAAAGRSRGICVHKKYPAVAHGKIKPVGRAFRRGNGYLSALRPGPELKADGAIAPCRIVGSLTAAY